MMAVVVQMQMVVDVVKMDAILAPDGAGGVLVGWQDYPLCVSDEWRLPERAFFVTHER